MHSPESTLATDIRTSAMLVTSCISLAVGLVMENRLDIWRRS